MYSIYIYIHTYNVETCWLLQVAETSLFSILDLKPHLGALSNFEETKRPNETGTTADSVTSFPCHTRHSVGHRSPIGDLTLIFSAAMFRDSG